MDEFHAKEAREQGVTTLFRAVGVNELAQIRATGQFEAGPRSMSGKWFAETSEHAARWGKLLEGAGNYIVVEAEVTSYIADALFRIVRLDGIGPAMYVEADQLHEVRVVGEVGE